MKKHILSILAAICTISQPLFSQTPTAATIAARQQPQVRVDEINPLVKLTPDQIKQANVLKTHLLKETLPLKNEIREKKARLKTLRTAANPDITQINALIDEISNLKSSIRKKKEANMQEFRKMLTDEQRIHFDTDRNEFLSHIYPQKRRKNEHLTPMQRTSRLQPPPPRQLDNNSNSGESSTPK